MVSGSDSTGQDAGSGTGGGSDTDAPDTGVASGGGAGVLPQPAQETAAGYAVFGAALDPGALLWDGVCLPHAQIRIPLAMLNRHGLVPGDTGTGKTKTIQLIA
ncbi:hypothetical protein GCM10010207_24430 [Streptomyces atratus]|nr:hypothetical protein GCM10010207_24430 [Streptomyces atratus]